MIIYHEVNADMLDSILAQGLKQTSHREKGREAVIIQTDRLLDDHLPDNLRQAGISRETNLYGYLAAGRNLISIENGALVPFTYKSSHDRSQALLRLDVIPERCYVSDLDIYDDIKSALSENASSHRLNEITSLYWNSLIPLNRYKRGQIARPEVMITYDVAPEHIAVIPSS
jgi:hypothetical protein